MAKTPKHTPTANSVTDEPGAEERFKGILKRALNTPPSRKREEVKAPQKPASRKHVR